MHHRAYVRGPGECGKHSADNGHPVWRAPGHRAGPPGVLLANRSLVCVDFKADRRTRRRRLLRTALVTASPQHRPVLRQESCRTPPRLQQGLAQVHNLSIPFWTANILLFSMRCLPQDPGLKIIVLCKQVAILIGDGKMKPLSYRLSIYL